jgi:hypothetical protein
MGARDGVSSIRGRVAATDRTNDREEIAMTNPMSQAAVPAAAAAAEDATRAEDGVTDTTHDSDGAPVGQADVEADARRAEEDTEPDQR